MTPGASTASTDRNQLSSTYFTGFWILSRNAESPATVPMGGGVLPRVAGWRGTGEVMPCRLVYVPQSIELSSGCPRKLRTRV